MSKSSMTHATAKQKESAEQASPRTTIRLDIQALRAVAVAGVVLYHLWPHRLHGGFVGVDVFFVISGFLITKHLVSRPPRNFTDVFDFWARRIRRLLPASLLVLTVTAVATYFVGAASAWQNTGKQIVSSAFYVQNWILASDSVDYLASENAPTAVQHFWSLSVEEQFYFVWPAVIGLLVALGIRISLRAFMFCWWASALLHSYLWSSPSGCRSTIRQGHTSSLRQGFGNSLQAGSSPFCSRSQHPITAQSRLHSRGQGASESSFRSYLFPEIWPSQGMLLFYQWYRRALSSLPIPNLDCPRIA